MNGHVIYLYEPNIFENYQKLQILYAIKVI